MKNNSFSRKERSKIVRKILIVHKWLINPLLERIDNFYWMNEFLERCLLFTKRTIFKQTFTKNDIFYSRNDFLGLMILLNERFYWTISEKTNEIYGKWTIILRTKKRIFPYFKKFEKLFVMDRWTNKMSNIRTCPSLTTLSIYVSRYTNFLETPFSLNPLYIESFFNILI